MPSLTITEAGRDDAALILNFIRALAAYERAPDEVTATLKDIEESLFGPEAVAKALICHLDGEAAGFAVYFFSYSTWLGKRGLYLEDLFVAPEYRGKGAGKALLKYLAETALALNCGRLEWSVLDWNEPAIAFYKSIGAAPQEEWIGYRLDGNALEGFASATEAISRVQTGTDGNSS